MQQVKKTAPSSALTSSWTYFTVAGGILVVDVVKAGTFVTTSQRVFLISCHTLFRFHQFQKIVKGSRVS